MYCLRYQTTIVERIPTGSLPGCSLLTRTKRPYPSTRIYQTKSRLPSTATPCARCATTTAPVWSITRSVPRRSRCLLKADNDRFADNFGNPPSCTARCAGTRAVRSAGAGRKIFIPLRMAFARSRSAMRWRLMSRERRRMEGWLCRSSVEIVAPARTLSLWDTISTCLFRGARRGADSHVMVATFKVETSY